jgi:hypothetical protein
VPAAIVALAIGVLTIALLAGCGGGDSGQAAATGDSAAATVESAAATGDSAPKADDSAAKTETGSLGKAQFIKKADALCAAGKARAKAAYFIALETHVSPEKETKAEHEAHDAALLKVVLSKAFRRQVSEIRALATRAGREAEVRAFLAAMDTAITKAASEPQTMIRFTGPGFARPDKLAREYGFAVCGRRK